MPEAETKEKTPEEQAQDNAYERLVENTENGEGELCDYCCLEDGHKGTHLGPKGPYGCEGQHCPEAFVLWMEEADKCDECGQYYLLDDMSLEADGSLRCVNCDESGD